ncbi:MAG: oligosaccharide flippase family protein [Pseudomonadota bacterium]
MIGSAALVFASNATAAVASLLRNLLLARLLSVEEFGIAASFSMFMTLVEAGQNAGLNRFVVQSRHGDDDAFIKSMHGTQLFLNVGVTLLFVLIAWPYALSLGTQSVLWAYVVLSMAPVVRILRHFDADRLQRHGRFLPSTLIQVIAQIISLAAIWPAFLWLGDSRAMLISLVALQAAMVVVSQIVSERPFRVAFDRTYVRQGLSFAWPILINGAVLFLVLNGDRIIVGNRFNLETLGWFSAAYMITLQPSMLLMQTIQSLALPRLAGSQKNASDFQQIYERTFQATLAASVLLVIGFGLLGEFTFTLLFGEKYSQASPFLVPLATLHACRLLRAAPSVAAIARAETKNPLYANIVRALFLPVGLAVAAYTGSIMHVVVVAIVAELAALFVAILMTNRVVSVQHKRLIAVSLLAGGIVICINLFQAGVRA